MTDATATPDAAPAPHRKKGGSLLELDARTRKRNAAEARFKAYGVIAITIGLLFLVALLFAIIRNGIPAFTQTFLTMEIVLDEETVEAAEGSIVATSQYRNMVAEALQVKLADVGIETDKEPRDLMLMLSPGVGAEVRRVVQESPELIGETVEFRFLTASRVDGYTKGRVQREDLARDRNLDATHLDIVDELMDQGVVERTFNLAFITGSDASESRPEEAGIGVSMLGSLFMMIVVLVCALPVGVAASIYLEEFAPKNRLTDFIEVNISNLAAVPSIVFGILGLAVFIQFAHLPQSAPLVGGLTLALMTLPTIVISTRASLKAVPPSIRDAALGVGASKMQAVFHHVLPLAAPGILTGTIIGLAQALGETAPLLLIGMVGFIASNYPDGLASGFLDPNSAMPAQIYEWAKRADPAYYERAWGGIIILLAFLMTMNIIAIILRRRFERRW